jgi:hypothetical protein
MKKILFFVVLVFITQSCQKAKENTADNAVDETAFADERKAFFNALKEPGEIAGQIEATAAEFSPSLMSDPKNSGVYISNEVKSAANLGVYLSDLNYCIAYKQRDLSKEYFAASHELSKAIGVDRAVLEFLIKRYNDNLEQNDSLKAVVTDLWIKSSRDFQGTERERLTGIAMSAYQIENLRLMLGTIESYPKDLLPDDGRTLILIPLFKMVLSQRSNMVLIHKFLETYSDPLDPDKNPNYPYYAQALKELIEVYNKLDVDQKIANNQGVELMNDAVVKELTEKVNAIRNKIVSVE